MIHPRHWRETFVELGRACGRVAAEYGDISRAAREPVVPYQVLLYMRPMLRAEAIRFRLRIGVDPKTATISELPVALPRNTLCMLAEIPATTADHALQTCMDVVRTGLQAEGLELRELRVEVQTGTRAEWEAKSSTTLYVFRSPPMER